MKDTMNRKNVARFHRMLADEVPLSKCSKMLKISIKTLKKFTPEAFKKAGVKTTSIAASPKNDAVEVTGTQAAAATAKPAESTGLANK